MDVLQAINDRRSIRKFRPEVISREQIEAVLAAGIEAPSSKNRQPWQFTVLESGAKEQFITTMKQGIARESQRPVLPGSAQYLAGAVRTCDIMKQAPVVILVENPLAMAFHMPQNMEDHFYSLANAQSVGAALQNMSLAAAELRLGSLWICDIFFAYEELCRWLGNDLQLLAAMALGVPDERPFKRPRNQMEKIVSWRKS